MSILNDIASSSLQIVTNSLHSEENKSIKSVDKREKVAHVNNATIIDSNKVRAIFRHIMLPCGFITNKINVCQYGINQIIVIFRIMQLE